MKKLILLTSLFYSGSGFAQTRIEYADFLQTDTAIKWAAVYTSYMNLAPVNPNFNIRNFYFNKLKQQGAVAYTEDSSAFAVYARHINYPHFISTVQKAGYDAAKMNWCFSYDEKNDASELIFNMESNDCDTCMIKNKLSFFKVKQLLYYKNNMLRIRNILLSPVIYKKTDKSFKEEAQYFETTNFAFNQIKSDESSIPSTAKLIGRSCNNLVLLPSQGNNGNDNKILTLNNWNLSALLYKDIMSRKLKAYDTQGSVYPDKKNMLDYNKVEGYKANAIEVQVVDSLGEITGYKKIMPEVNFDSIYNYTLIQDLYFDFEKEKLYSKLVALAPRISVITSTGVNLGLTNYWGVIFPEEKKKIIRKTK